MRILTLLARYGTEQYPKADAKIADLVRRKAPAAEHTLLVVDNALPPGHVERPGGRTTVIGGDNSWHEFSGWEKAIRHLGSDVRDFDVVNLATSAFEMLYNAYLERFDSTVLELVRRRPIAAGHIDYYPHPVVCGPYVSQHWLRTSFLFVAPRELLCLGSLVSTPERAVLFSGDPARPFRDEAPISPGYRKLILDWLTSPAGTGQGTAWHSRFEVTAETLPRFEDKTLAILNEHGLSARLRARGCDAADLTYLEDLGARRRAEEGRVPSWRTQVAARGSESHAYPVATRWA